MPYQWTNPGSDEQTLRLWPHNSLPPKGFAIAILSVGALALVPLLAFLGSALLWGILPFLLLALWGLWAGLQANYRARRVLEVLTLSDSVAHLVRHDPDGHTREWDCNRYWAQAQLHVQGGPMPNYVTLKGAGREVEIGAFLSEEERVALYDELVVKMRA